MTSSPDRFADGPFTGVTLGGRYRLDGLIGRGGMASVYRGEDLSLGRSVAVKVFAEAAEGIDDAARRRSETALLASVEHRALVRLYDAAHDGAIDREYLVMELVEGQDLRKALQHGPVGTAEAAGLAADLAEALHVIHARGIVHRDVKPGNVLLAPSHLPTRSWDAKLADFGIARLIDDARLTRTGAYVGTPGYLSPEQVSGRAPGVASDIYSLGLVLLEARTGRQAFPGPAVEAAAARLVGDPEIPALLGTEWVELLRGMTAREASDRPTALDVAIAAGRLPSVPEPASAETNRADAATTVLHEASDAPTLVLPASRTAAASSAATTAVLGTPEGADGAVAARAVASAFEPAPTPSRRWVRPAIAVGLLVVIAIGIALLVPPVVASLTGPQPVPTETLPTLPGELGVHLEQLEEAVTR
ncbi:serine/threonine protein kinase [Agromyces cerinus]|uniref:serine/threonine-protein kinase n=1 Tax=Agromyces cerinus TaxID=33878 RepID=UPI00195D8AAE|nr:serine/threonine-protein kinase [Agromyces cerinus]MBM7832665.1 serine/threonine protein kinase [Agromyces cerinus]